MDSKNRKIGLSLPQQMYVEAIDELVQKHGHAHSVEISRLLGVKKPSVTEVVSRLVALKIAKRSDQEVTLTKKGRAIAIELAYRHETLRRFMVDVLEMDSDNANEMACRIEHSAGHEFVQRLLLLDEFIQSKEMASYKKQWCSFRRNVQAKRK